MKTTTILLGTLLWLSARADAQNCAGTSTGQVPLSDLGSSSYQGFSGGLYPGGANGRPAAHDTAGLSIASQIVPLDAAGNVDTANGKIGFASLGMSNTTQEFQQFLPLAAADTSLNPKLVVVDGAQGGMAAEQWQDPTNSCWATFDSRLAAAGVSPAQLQAVWVKLTARASSVPSTFPAGAQQIQAWIRQSILNLKFKYPSVRVVYLSSRIYAGYATSTLNPEPLAYESGFSVKWLVEAQISGDTGLAYTGSNPPAPWLSWGPYLWADGLGSDNAVGGVPGRSDGLEWLCGEYQPDGTHPSTSGAQKVAGILMNWLKTDTTSVTWFLASPPAPTDSDGDGLPDSWEMAYWGNLTQTAGGDPDGDSFSNLQEYQAGTDPTTAASYPGAPPSGGGGGGGSCGSLGLDVLALLGLVGLGRRRTT